MSSRYLFDDGVHYVRAATAKDKHPMRFVVRPHRAAESKRARRAPTEEEAIEAAKSFTTDACAASRADAELYQSHHTHHTQPGDTAPAVMTTRQTSSAAKDNLSTKTFTCVRCNPTASVWRCDGRPQGREVKWLHQKGDLAVFEGSEPVRLSSGDIRVFQSIGEAETYALDLYARDTESIFWEDGRPVIDTTFFIDIIYDPPTYGDARPFVCWIRDPFDKPIYEEPRPSRYAKAGAKRAGGNVADEAGNKDELAAIAAAKRLKAIASEEGSKVYSERPKTFATPWGAREAAEKHERTIMYGYLPGWMQDHYDRKGRL